jgi:nitrogenase subunit NifH
MILGYMDKANQAISSQTGHSSNMAGLSTSKKEREIARILATKFHTETAIELGLEVKINPIMKDLIINRPTVKKKWNKWQKTENMAETAESIEENQSAWLVTLKEDIAELK